MVKLEQGEIQKIKRERIRHSPRCSKCATPKILPWLFCWQDGGAITLKYFSHNFRFAFIENDLLNEIIDVLIAQFDEESVFQIIREAEKGSAGEYVSLVLLSSNKFMAPISYIIRKSSLMDRILEMNMVFLGYGVGRLTKKTNTSASCYARNLYNRILFSADLEACFVVAFSRDGDVTTHSFSEKEGEYMLQITGQGQINPRLMFEQYRITPPPITVPPKPFLFKTCPKCGVPEQITDFWWDDRLGMIIHKGTGKRMILWPSYALERLLSALEKSLGEVAREIIFNTVKEYQKNSILSEGVGLTEEEKIEFALADKPDQYQLLLKHLACLGFGHGTVEELGENSEVKISIYNPLSPPVTSGLILGLVESLEDKTMKLSWKEKDCVTTYTVKPK